MRFILGVVSALALLGAGAVTMTVLSTNGTSPNMASVAPEKAPVEVAEDQAAAEIPALVTKSATISGLEDIQAIPVLQTPPKVAQPAETAKVIIAQATAEAPRLEAPASIAPLTADLSRIESQPSLKAVTFLAAVEDTSPRPPSADTVPPAPIEVLYVSGRRVNMRSGPGSRYGWVATLERGAQLMVVEKGDRWYKVSGMHDGNVVRGWMAGNFLTSAPQQIEASN